MASDSLLDDLTVVDVTQEYNGFTGKCLSDLGAEVIKVEPPSGDRARRIPPHTTERPHPNASAFFGFLNTGKRSLVVDPEAGPDDLLALCERADIIIEDGLEVYDTSAEELRERFPELVVVSLNGFGRTGPHADWESTSIVEAAGSGVMHLTGYPDREPTTPGGSLVTYIGLLHGAVGALMAIRNRDVAGAGGDLVDVSKQEAIVAHLESENTDYEYNGSISTRTGNKHPLGHPIGSIYPTEDGHICLCLVGTYTEGPMGGQDLSMWEPFCKLIGREDLLEDERFNSLPDDDEIGATKRLRNADELDSILAEELAERDDQAFYKEAQEQGLSVSIVPKPADIFNDRQLAARDFLGDLELPNGNSVTLPTAPYQFSNVDVDPSQPPKLDEYAEEVEKFEGTVEQPSTDAESLDNGSANPRQALNGVRILDFTQVWAGPCGTKILADHGADVIKVESSERPDVIRTTRPLFENEQGDPLHGEDRSGYFQTENRGKRSLSVNLKTDEGVQLVKDLIRSGEIDVVTESFAPGAMERLGLDYETLRELDDELIMCSVSGYGEEGPESDYRAYGAMLGPHAGIASMTGFEDDLPVSVGVAIVDPLSGLNEAYAIMAALYARRNGDGGQYIDLSMREAGIMLTHRNLATFDITGERLPRIGNRDERGKYVQGCYRTRGTNLHQDEEAWIALSVRDDTDWQSLKDVFGNPSWMAGDEFADQASRIDNHDALDEKLASAVGSRNRYEAVEELQKAGIPASVVQSTRDLLERDEQLSTRDFWTPIVHPVIGEQRYPTALPRLKSTPGQANDPAPMLGEHSRKIIYELLDVSGSEIASLEESGALE